MSTENPKIVAGIDYSMSCPCICIYDTSKEFTFENCKFFFITKTKKYQGQIMENVFGFEPPEETKTDIHRYLKIGDWAMRRLMKNDVTDVYLEGYSMGSKGQVFNIAENTAILKVGLHLAKIPVEFLAPTSVKKFGSGKGNADKKFMHDSFHAETKVNLQEELSPGSEKIGSPVGDIVDSFYICKMGLFR